MSVACDNSRTEGRQTFEPDSVEDIITDDVDALWDRTEAHAGIDRDLFFTYFSGRDVGHAIAIGKVKGYKEPRDIGTAYWVRPPQSFRYL
jgi:predicted transcriptional regulator